MEPDIIEFEHSVDIIDKMIHDSACLLTIEQWEELLQALKIVIPTSSLVVDSLSDDGGEEIEWVNN